jgi:uncharacterized membrane protein
VDWYDWLLFFHVLGAFVMVGGTVLYWTILVAGWRVDRPSIAAAFFRVARPADILVPAASVATLAGVRAATEKTDAGVRSCSRPLE